MGLRHVPPHAPPPRRSDALRLPRLWTFVPSVDLSYLAIKLTFRPLNALPDFMAWRRHCVCAIGTASSLRPNLSRNQLPSVAVSDDYLYHLAVDCHLDCRLVKCNDGLCLVTVFEAQRCGITRPRIRPFLK